MRQVQMSEEEARGARERAAQQLWLLYFNQVAYKKGFVTERQRNQLKSRILRQLPSDRT